MKRMNSETLITEELDDNRNRNKARKKRKRSDVSGELNAANSTSEKNTNEKVGPFLYVPGELFPLLTPYIGSSIEVHVPAYHLNRDNDQVFASRQVWGDELYTDDSDIVSILHHTGHYYLPKSGTIPNIYALVVTLKVLPGQDSYQSVERNNLKSRSWGKHSVSLKVLGVKVINRENKITKELIKKQKAMNGATKSKESKRNFTKKARTAFAEDDDELRKYHVDLYPETTTIQFNLSNEPCFKYNLNLMCDRGNDPSSWTSSRFRTSVLYLESKTSRFVN
eukprot:TRINITY_DN7570_c0_g2_i1.p1 TRINITY_DN7570_c0_g2~~TRINITY_DN7570_c0_g2_i1.p1  ORF type:complete len:280 (+),score=31.75 TRINITY_DN7570_c0_g2_i1:83-922(+)